MGKSLIIKGADFSANGFPVTVVAGTFTITNTQDNALNVSISKSELEALNLNVGNVQVNLYSNDSSVNTKLSGKTIKLKASLNGSLPDITTFTYGSVATMPYPPSEQTWYGIILQCADLSGMNGKEVIVEIYKN